MRSAKLVYKRARNRLKGPCVDLPPGITLEVQTHSLHIPSKRLIGQHVVVYVSEVTDTWHLAS